MKAANERVIAVIPHYNSPETAINLITQLKQDNFDAIYLLDDASVPEKVTSIKIAHGDIHVVKGKQNLGAGGNRNRILSHLSDEILYFIDADMEQLSQNVADTLRESFRENRNRLVGGIILTKTGTPMHWNYGHEMHPVRDARFEALNNLLAMSKGEMQSRIFDELHDYGWDYPWLVGEVPNERQVDWVAEGCFALSVEAMRAIDGYDQAMRYHEGQDLAHRLRIHGLEVFVNSVVKARHLEVDVRTNKKGDFNESQFYFFHKHWGMSREVYDELYDNREVKKD